ncbi:7TM-DISM domain-containing protein [Fulvivirga kasyanovii]|uniref:7TM-DISM domain-containing protein n=1 Tax=Fulvivirga kasyanovii TaxID=396812 RepID=UPI0016265B26|nr:7TM-DISM domain-containing protein [Fulvivirga kasyanovii]
MFCLLILLPSFSNSQSITGVKLYYESNKRLTIDEVTHLQFEAIELPYAITSNGSDVFWISFNIECSDKDVDKAILEFFDWPYVDIFYQKEDVWVKEQTGNLVPFKNRSVPLGNRLLLTVPLQKHTYYAKLKINGNALKFPGEIRIQAHTPYHVLTEENANRDVAFFVNGALFCILIFLIFLYYRSKDKSLLIFLAYIILWMYTIIHNSGVIFSLFSSFSSLPKYFAYFDLWLSSAITILAIHVMYQLVPFKKYFIWEKKLFNFLIWTLCIFPLLTIFVGNLVAVTLPLYIVVVIVVVCFLYISISALYRKIPLSLLFFVANVPFYGGCIFFLLSGSGLISTYGNYHNVFLHLGVLFQASFFAVMFSFRYDRLRFANEKKREKILNQNQQLSALSMNLDRKNKVFSKVHEQAKSSGTGLEAKQVLKLIEDDFAFDKRWDDFKMHFEKVNQDFFKKLLSKHPDLSLNDKKMCAYLKLNLSSKEIAQLLHISPGAVEKSRYRLRKKLNLKKHELLTSYIQNF